MIEYIKVTKIICDCCGKTCIFHEDKTCSFFTESRSRAEYKARKIDGYKCTIWLSEQNGNLFHEHKRVEI